MQLKTANASTSTTTTISSGSAVAGCRVIVFFTTCAAVDFHYELLTRLSNLDVLAGGGSGVAAGLGEVASLAAVMRGRLYRLHGDIPQDDRMNTFGSFCGGESGILLCTDVAARGLDMPDINWIIQYDPPSEITEYVHRIGRTARRGQAGSSLIMLRPCEANYVALLKKRLSIKLIELPANSLAEGLCDRHHGRAGGSRRRDVALRRGRSLQVLMERIVAGDALLKEHAGHAFHTSVRAYACHSKESKKIFNVRRLHLGHVAKSFALRDPPSKIMSKSRESKMLKKQLKHKTREANVAHKSGGVSSEFDWNAGKKAKKSKAGVGNDRGENEQVFRGFTIHGQTGNVPESRKRKKDIVPNKMLQKRRKGSTNVDFAKEQAEAMSTLLKFGEGGTSHHTSRSSQGAPSSAMDFDTDDDDEIQTLLSSADVAKKAPPSAIKAKFKKRYASAKVDEPIWARGMGKGSTHSSSVSEFF